MYPMASFKDLLRGLTRGVNWPQQGEAKNVLTFLGAAGKIRDLQK